MNYAAHYNRLMDRARGRVLVGYQEKHHVIPRCMGGGNSPENIVRLTPEEHYVAHQLLIKMHPNVLGLVLAASMMSKRVNGNKPYGWLKRKHAKLRTGVPRTPEVREKMLAAIRTVSAREKMIKHHRSEEFRRKAAETQRGKTYSAESRAKMSAAKLGKKQSPEHVKNKLATASRGEKHWAARLTAQQVREIRSSNVVSERIGPLYGISGRAVRAIRNRVIWRHVP